MAKRKQRKNIRKVSSFDEVELVEYENTDGIIVLLSSMPPMSVPRLAASIRRPKVPTYEIETVSGDVEVHQHEVNEETGVSTLATDEDREAWEKYKKEDNEADSLFTERLVNSMLFESVTLTNEEEALEWYDSQIMLEKLNKTPEEIVEIEERERNVPEAMRLHIYKQEKVLANQYDIEQIMKLVMELTGVSEEDIQAVEGSFPDSVEPESPTE